MTHGAMGKVLWVDLTTGTFTVQQIEDEIYESYLTGVGLGVRLMYDRIPAGADPLGPDNVLGLTSGILCGTGALFSGRWMVMAKSPLTGGWGDSNCGGNFAPAIKKAGFDAIFFTGISAKPVYLKIVGDDISLVDASHLWGMDTIEAEAKLIAEVGPKAKAIAIGPAGEKLSLISGIVNDGGRIAARSGLGAVMGSKRLKGVVLAGTAPIKGADPAKIKSLNKEFLKWFRKGAALESVLSAGFLSQFGRLQRVLPVSMAVAPELFKTVLKKFGTISANVLSSQNGDSPVKNWKGSGTADFPIGTHAGKLNPQKIIDRETKKYKCYSCPLGCGGEVTLKGGGTGHKPEYETTAAFGSLLLNNDIEALFEVNELLNRAGMDSISAGGAVAFTIECLEQGVLTKNDVDGLDLDWGNSEAVLALIKKMIAREGIGDLLADGVKIAAEKIGKNAGRFAMHAGGQELPMHDSRFDPGYGVCYTVEPTPGRHTNHGYQVIDLLGLHEVFPGLPKIKHVSLVKSKYDPTDRWILQVAASKYIQLFNAAGGCLFGAQLGGHLPIIGYLNAAGGWNHEPDHYLQIGERIQALRQAFNFKHGIQPITDYALPPRATGAEPLTTGPMKGVTLDMDRLRTDFLKGMRWDPQTAKPTKAALADLGLADVAEEINAP
ncbi:MAG: aldehyde ferredoxin oxidoreductase family protein [Candidatus Lernaella stagnicola]|nr:aldehyde ferredoxin oxidoreductase family protein [Candidatus Lernaella stagnicola]